jgi:hypothetical protein
MHPRHQEDVVVDPERHQEHEEEQRPQRVWSGKAEHVPEDQRAESHRGPEQQHNRPDQDQRRNDRPEQQHQDEEHHEQDQRDDDRVVIAGGLQRAPRVAESPPSNGISAGDRVDPRTDLADIVYRRLAVGSDPESARQAGPVTLDHG